MAKKKKTKAQKKAHAAAVKRAAKLHRAALGRR